MIYGYVRVSTDKQTVENQRFEITQYCESNGLIVDGWIGEEVSGTVKPEKRKLGKLLKKMKKGDVIICTELSRLGRSLLMVMGILNLCMERDVQVWALKEGYRLGDNISSKVLAFAFGLSAEIERELISKRTKEALARKKQEGGSLGRKRGVKMRCLLDDKEAEVRQMLERKIPILRICKRLKVSPPTFYRFIKRIGIERGA